MRSGDRIDLLLALALGVLLCIGLLSVYSADSGGDLFYRQLAVVAVGLVVFTVAYNIPLRMIEELSPFVYPPVAALLVLTMFFGQGPAGRWLVIGPVNLMNDVSRREEKFAAASARIPAIASAIRERRVSVPEGSNSGLWRLGGRLSRHLATVVYDTPSHLHATKACNQCRTCERICPTRNITVGKDTVVFGNDCTQCYACIHWCPNGAIEIGGRTKGNARYHHPDVTVRDMLDQRGE